MAVAFQFDFESALAAIVYLTSKKPDTFDKYRLGKLIFLADKSHLVRYARPITGDAFCAMEWGPVPSTTLHLLNALLGENFEDARVRKLGEFLFIDRRYEYPRFTAKNEIKFDNFLSRSDIEILEEILKLHGKKSFDELKALTHEMPAYKNAWGSGEVKNAPMRFEDFFEEDGDAIRGVREEMIENDELRKTFGTRV